MERGKVDEGTWRGAKEMSSNVLASIFDVLLDEGDVIIHLTALMGIINFTT